MQLKPVPEAPDDLDFVADAQRALPLVPGAEDDCCARLMRRLDLPSRDVARTWLTFLRALVLAEETPSGFKRTDTAVDPERLREAFRDRVFLAGAVLDALPPTGSGAAESAALTADETFEEVRDRVPKWERSRRENWERYWRDRVARQLEWAVLLGLAERAEGTEDAPRYRRVVAGDE